MTRRPLLSCLAALAVLFAHAAVASADEGSAQWRLQQPPPPPPPVGVAAAPFPVPIGKVGDIKFWAPNRGVLVTAGNSTVPMGLYAYDGAGWHLLATVCGGTDGRVAWAGPDEFWTVADQRAGQLGATGSSQPPPLDDRSLCHFENGQFVASYALPAGRPDSYQAMHGAACASPTDCWFGGDLVTSPPPLGAFHLHWDGQALTSIPSTSFPVNTDPAHVVRDIVADRGGFFESVDISPGDPSNPAVTESPTDPPRLHSISTGAAEPFTSLAVPLDRGRDPNGHAVPAVNLAAAQLDSDGSQVWAVAGAVNDNANVVAARSVAGGPFVQITLLTLADGAPAFPYGSSVTDVAAEPGTANAWVAFQPPDGDGEPDLTRVAHVSADGTVTIDTLPDPDDPVGSKGPADKVACDAHHDCWVATTKGWLFHLSDGAAPATDTDPSFTGIITDRPSDHGVPFVPPLDLPPDDSLDNQAPPPTPIPTPAPPASKKTPKKLVTKISRPKRLGKTTTVAVSFTLTSKASVRLVATRRKRVVARTPSRRMKAGRHTLKLRLNRRKWPTALDVKAKAIGKPQDTSDTDLSTTT